MEDQEESVSPNLATAMTLIKRFAYPDPNLTGDLFLSKSASQSSQFQSDIITLYFIEFILFNDKESVWLNKYDIYESTKVIELTFVIKLNSMHLIF